MNAKEEIIEEIGDKEVLHIKVAFNNIYSNKNTRHFEGGLDVIEQLNFEYDSGYGLQELFGFIWYKDGTWSERAEYDGSEWWEYKKRPSLDVAVG